MATLYLFPLESNQGGDGYVTDADGSKSVQIPIAYSTARYVVMLCNLRGGLASSSLGYGTNSTNSSFTVFANVASHHGFCWFTVGV